MEAVTELGLCYQVISSIKTQEWVSLFIYFGFTSVGEEKEGKRMAPVQHKSDVTFLLSTSRCRVRISDRPGACCHGKHYAGSAQTKRETERVPV